MTAGELLEKSHRSVGGNTESHHFLQREAQELETLSCLPFFCERKHDVCDGFPILKANSDFSNSNIVALHASLAYQKAETSLLLTAAI